ncbi:MAG: M6 family metalloprotease domain-containing protein [Paludibacteraceae bacterium]|nr:M6 family metalloprotease domain-containing protein [Paludibacteraceae bacterium]
MKKLFLLLAVLSTVGLWAVPAHRQWRTVTQTDGSVIEVMTIGDEFYHYTINRAGQQVRETNGVYQVVGEAPTAEVVKARRAKAVARRQRKDIGTTPNLAPKGVVILANFSDKSMQSGHTQATFDELCNSLNCTVNSGYPSAAQYFADQSKGAYRPQFDVYGPVTLSRALSYYGADKNNEEGDDQHATDVVVEACILANQQDTINWADYDSDNDGYIDFVYVIYAGKGQADGGSSETIWPHNWKVSDARSSGYCTYTASECKVGGKVIENYAMSSELSSNSLCGIGTLCHEFGHVMGLPDLYDTNYNTNYESCLTPNDWNIMDLGSYNADGHCPPNYDPWQKDFFGWHTPVNLGSEPQNVTLYANGTENYQAYQINASGSYVGPTTSGERYYIENRQQTGWDAPLTGHGMLVWQVNFNASKWTNNEPNNTANSPYYTVVSASGTKIGTDTGGTNNCPWNTFPGTKNVNTYSPISDRALTDITEASNIVTCKFNSGASVTPTDTTSTGTTNNETKWYAIGWINGEDAGESAYSTFNDTYMFRDGKLTINCAMGSYIAIKDQDTNFYYSRTEATVADTVVTLEWANGWNGAQKWAIPEGTNYIIIREASPKGSITLERVNKATYDAYPFTPTDTIPDTPKDTIPTAAILATMYDVTNNMVLCLQFVDDAKVCGDVYFVGENNNWGKGTGTVESFDNCLKFQQVPGFEGWYAVEVPFTGSFEGKPMHVSEDKAWTWDYQCGDVNAWSYVSGKRLQLTAGYTGECNVAYASAGAYIYRLKYWKKHNNPCEAQITRDYTIRLYAPDACPEMKPAIIGDFNNWSVNMPMREEEDASGRTVYTYTLTDVVGHTFKIREENDTAWTNEMQYYWAEEDYWVAFPNIELGMTETLELDWSDNDNYRFAQCVSGSSIDDPVYTIVLSDPVCEENPEFFPMILCNGGSLNFERGDYMGSEAWMATVHAQPGSYYQLLEANYSYGNQLQYLDSTTGWWWSFLPRPFPESVEDTTVLVFDYSNPERYRYPLCGKLHYDDSTYVNINVTLKAPAGAPEKIAIVGDFISGLYNSWEKGSLMTYKNGEYRVTVKATANSQFKFREYKGYSNYIEYTDGGAMENLVFGEFMDTANNVYVDLSNTARYRWVEWSDYIPKEIYSVTVQADNTENGSVTGGGEYNEGETAVIMAKPRMDCVFEGWSDGNQLNPRSVTVMSDTAFTAVFRRNIPIQPVEMFDTMYFTAADTTLIAVRVYAPSEIEPYDKLIIATVDNKNIMGSQALIAGNEQNYRSTVTYTPNMNIATVSVVEVVPNGTYYRLRVEDGELAPRCEDCYQKLNQLYAVPVGADWYFTQYGKSVVPEAAAYANRMILYNEEAPRFSSYRQVTGLEREQTTVFKLNAKRVIPQEPTVVEEDLSALVEEENPMDEATVAMEVEPADTIAVISMPYVEFVHSFTLIVWADEARTQVLMMITYDASGHVISVTKPNAVRRLMPREEGEVTFEIDDLEPETTYPYTLVACEDDGSILTSLNSSFTTTNGTEGIRNVFDHSSHTVKFLMNGQLFILRDGKLYNALGVQVKHL